jgi:hypothetical protein
MVHNKEIINENSIGMSLCQLDRINPAEKNSKGQEASVHELKKQSNDRQISYFLFQAASRTFSNLGT